MAQPKNTQLPCFCNQSCPPGTRPSRSYLLWTDIPLKFPEYAEGRMYVFDFQIPENKFCLYVPQTPIPGYLSEKFDKSWATMSGGLHRWSWASGIAGSDGDLYVFGVNYDWHDDDHPIDPLTLPSCGAELFTLAALDPPAATIPLYARPLPEWVCDQDQAVNWAAQYPLL